MMVLNSVIQALAFLKARQRKTCRYCSFQLSLDTSRLAQSQNKQATKVHITIHVPGFLEL